MRTEDLITALTADAGVKKPGLDHVWTIALLGGLAIASLVFFTAIGPRPDFLAAMQTIRFDFKFVLTLSLAVSAFALLRKTAIPGAHVGLPLLLIAPALGLLAVIAELIVLPTSAWAMAAIGKNALYCLTLIPLISIAPVIALTLGLRRGAPTNPALSGALAGLTAGAIGATLYAAHCTDDSPLFVMIWYPIAVAMVTTAGAVLGRVFARW